MRMDSIIFNYDKIALPSARNQLFLVTYTLIKLLLAVHKKTENKLVENNFGNRSVYNNWSCRVLLKAKII